MTSKFDECFIHIGTPKTGTSTLQEFFFKNKENLSKKGILFPDSFGEINHTKLYVSVGNYNEGRVYFPFADGITNDELQKEFRDNIENNFQQEIASMECTKLLISSEAFSKLLFEVHDVQSLKNFLDNFVNKYKIIIYLRPQHEYAISSYKTLLGSGIEKKNVLGEPSDNPIWNYDHLLSKWENVFGTENIIPRIFSKNEFPDGDIKKDFISILKLDFSDFDDVKSLNESVSADALRFMLEINRYLPVFINNKRNKNRGNISRLVFSKSHGKGLLPTREQAINFFNYFTKSNEKVREKWFPERKELFEVDFTKYPEKAQEYPEIDHSAFEIFADLWTEKQKQITWLQKKLESK